MDLDELKEIHDLGHELRHVEGKESQDWGLAEFHGKVVKTIMGMANLPGGGKVIIGLPEDANKRFTRAGVKPEHMASLNPDQITNKVGEYSDPPPDVKIMVVAWEHEKYVAIEVEPFKTVPIVCKKDGPGGLKRGALYTRPQDARETHPVRTEREMREILESALHRTRIEFAEMLLKMGIAVQGTASDAGAIDIYAAETEDLP